jgi:hypothetical protein
MSKSSNNSEKALEIKNINETNNDEMYDDEWTESDEKRLQEQIAKEDLVNEAYAAMREYEDEEEKLETKKNPQLEFNRLFNLYFNLNPYMKTYDKNYELEVKFGTKGIKPLTKNDYDNVIKTIKSLGFTTNDYSGLHSLRVNCEYLDKNTGKFKMSNIRTEINGLNSIENYCKNNDLKQLYRENPLCIKFLDKKAMMIGVPPKRVKNVDFNDFNFRVSLQTENLVKKNLETYLIENWRKSKKEFRYLNRITFIHPDYPFNIDLSIVKSGTKMKMINKQGIEYSTIIPVYTLDESNLFNNPESYEIEIEVNNNLIGPGTNFDNPENLLILLRKTIKFILSGLQGTMYPISYNEQNEISNEYMNMISDDEYIKKKYISSYNFIGPNSITLQLKNIVPLDENNIVPNIRSNFVITDKADGERHMLYISKIGKIYLISSLMNIKFTGAFTKNKNYFNSLLDGELILNDKNGNFINLYAAFDIYYLKNKDIRANKFIIDEENENIYTSRYYLLQRLIKDINALSILDYDNNEMLKQSVSKKSKVKDIDSELIRTTNICPINITYKKFYPSSDKQNIFEACRNLIRKQNEGLFEYETDGLIFTHKYFGVGSNKIGEAGPKSKITWEYSFKWKPPQFNTIDFLITTLKDSNGRDIIKSLYEDGLDTSSAIQYNEYKIIELRCGFNEKIDGYINPCQNIYDDILPEFKTRYEEKHENNYLPKRFYPTEPYDINAGLCKIILKTDDSGAKQMFTLNDEVILDNTIVEFSYDLDKEEGWRWQPLRIRYDKTAKLRNGEKEFGNAYRVCNENWKSIHPSGRITEEMLSTGLGIPDLTISEDIYYNSQAGPIKTEALKNFHNLYVKKLLINGVSKRGDTLIDFACGKAGDLPKWIASKLSFVFGIDYSNDNLENRLDGACTRYLNSRKDNKFVPYALFVHGNSSLNIKNGNAMLNDKAKQVCNAVFGIGPKNIEKLGSGVARQYGKGSDGFNVSSCQFAIHYFFENPDSLIGFLRNIAECTKLNGYFIGTCYDGKLIFNELRNIKTNESIQINDNGKKIWEIIKKYNSSTFENNSSSIGYKIIVYQETINQYISEYLVNFDYLIRLMEIYGFITINNDEAKEMGLQEGTGLFSNLFINMIDEIQRNKFKSNNYKEAPNMTSYEKKISFLNRYFIFKKVREVNLDKIKLELDEYQEALETKEAEETKHAIIIAKDTIKSTKPKIKKLSKKLILIPASDSTESTETTKPTEPTEPNQNIIVNDTSKLEDSDSDEEFVIKIIKDKKPKKKGETKKTKKTKL